MSEGLKLAREILGGSVRSKTVDLLAQEVLRLYTEVEWHATSQLHTHEEKIAHARACLDSPTRYAMGADMPCPRGHVRPGHHPPCPAMLDDEAVCTCGQ